MAVWSPEEIQILKAYAAKGASKTRIAARLQRTTAAVRALAKKHGVALKSKQQVREANGICQHWSNNRSF